MATIREEIPEDYEAVERVVDDAFERWLSEESTLVRNLRRDQSNFLPRLSLVAEDHLTHRIVGHILLTRAELLNDERSTVVGHIWALAPLAVAKSHQQRGIGSALTVAALEQCAALCREGASNQYPNLVAVVGYPQFYRKFGFQPARAQPFCLEVPFPAPDDAFLALPVTAEAAQALEFEPQQKSVRYIRYAPAFSELS